MGQAVLQLIQFLYAYFESGQAGNDESFTGHSWWSTGRSLGFSKVYTVGASDCKELHFLFNIREVYWHAYCIFFQGLWPKYTVFLTGEIWLGKIMKFFSSIFLKGNYHNHSCCHFGYSFQFLTKWLYRSPEEVRKWKKYYHFVQTQLKPLRIRTRIHHKNRVNILSFHYVIGSVGTLKTDWENLWFHMCLSIDSV